MWFLDFRTRDVGGPVAPLPRLYEGLQLRGPGLSALPPTSRPICFVVHGFNNSRAAGMKATAGFAASAVDKVPALKGSLLVGVLWPGDAIFGAVSYPTEEADADNTANAFAQELVRARLPIAPNFVAHSLGCRVALATLDILARVSDISWVDQLVLFAGAVDADALGRPDRYLAAVRNARRVVNVASTSDAVLRFAFPAGDWLAGLFGGGYSRSALGRHGPASAPRVPDNVSVFQVGQHNVGHGDYLGGDNDLRKRASKFGGRAVTGDVGLQY